MASRVQQSNGFVKPFRQQACFTVVAGYSANVEPRHPISLDRGPGYPVQVSQANKHVLYSGCVSD